ncbi:hypothetical protein [Neomicrococcus lactis]|uniref:Uncharacterized protein n=1 Tax=Neomicrococcus lactis TaxID=732241 RepID=A0A7W8YBK6_9MICC|nr:hypothetical protein [Neomicrococcus lactis]MBB5598544.1 hypothetical protein [Neomicrococcus lactis]
MNQTDVQRDKGAIRSLGAASVAPVVGLLAILLIPGNAGLVLGVLLMGLGIIPAMRVAEERWVKIGIAALMIGYIAVAVGIALLARAQ